MSEREESTSEETPDLDLSTEEDEEVAEHVRGGARGALERLRRGSPDEQRLDAVIAGCRGRLDWREATGAKDTAWLAKARVLLSAADSALETHEREKAWACVHEALRLEVHGYGRAELDAARVALRHEAQEKLDSWRRASVLDVLARHDRLEDLVTRSIPDEGVAAKIVDLLKAPSDGDGAERARALLRSSGADLAEPLATLLTDIAADRVGGTTDAAQRMALISAMQIRDEHSANVYRRFALLRRQLLALSLVLVGTLAGILVMAAWLPLALEKPPTGARTWVWVLLFGTLGGSLTSLLAANGTGAGARVPEQRSQLLVAAARPLVGGAAALLAYALFAADVLRIGATESAAALLALAFVAGFSERLVTGAVESVAGR